MSYRVVLAFFLAYLFIVSPTVSPTVAQTVSSKTDSTGIYAPLVTQGLEVVEFTVPVDGHQVTAVIASPPRERLHANPVLLLTVGGSMSLVHPAFDLPAKFFWERGHRVVSFPVPSLGSLAAFGDLALKGPDPTLAFIEEAQAVLKYCVGQKWAKPGRTVVVGNSRCAYMAFRLMAADDQLNIGGGFAPVTDWRDLSEIRDKRERKEIADLRLSLFADKLAGKKIYLSISSHDERVSTLSCCQLFLDLNAANQKRGFDGTLVDFFVTPDIGHTCGVEWYERGIKILLDAAVSQDKK